MIYVLLIITLVTLSLVVVSFWANDANTKFIQANVKKNRENDQLRQDKFDNLVRDFLKAITLINNAQEDLDNKMNAFSAFVDEQNTYVTFQQNEFNALAKADMLASRRNELILAKRFKVALERLMGSAMYSRQPAASQDILELENLDKRISELEYILMSNEHSFPKESNI